MALDYLQSLGHRAITLLLNEPEENGNVIHRAKVFEEEIAKRGLVEARIVHCGAHFFEDTFESAYRTMPEVMATAPETTAIFSMSDPGAWGVLKWLAENNISVPKQISVLGFSDDRHSRFTHPALTTIAHPITEIARCSLQIIKGDGKKSGAIWLTPELVIRESTDVVASVPSHASA